jgi:hypothetical protein
MVLLDAESLAFVRDDERVTFVTKHIELRPIWQAQAIRTNHIVKVYENMWMTLLVLKFNNLAGLRAQSICTQAHMRIYWASNNTRLKEIPQRIMKLWQPVKTIIHDFKPIKEYHRRMPGQLCGKLKRIELKCGGISSR